MRRFAKPVNGVKPFRGFKSRSLRFTNKARRKVLIKKALRRALFFVPIDWVKIGPKTEKTAG